MNSIYTLWLPLTAIYYAVYTWMSKQNNDEGGNWWWIMYLFGAICPFWVIISRHSKNLYADGLVYDLVMFFSYVLTMAFLGGGAKFTGLQWGGLAFIVTGFVMIKSGFKI